MSGKPFKRSMVLLQTLVLAGSVAAPAVLGQSNQGQADPGNTAAQPIRSGSSPSAPVSRLSSPAIAGHRSLRQEQFYESFWGISNLEVRQTASGSLLRFTYRVVDAKKAQMFNDKKATAVLIDEQTGNVLQVPALPKVGMLRQTGDLENGREYWIAFSNKGFIKPGSRVDVVVGNFRANGLIVQ